MNPDLRKRLRVIAAWTAGWTVLALVTWISDYVQFRTVMGDRARLMAAFPKYVILFGAWGAMSPAVVALVRRFPVEAPRRVRNLCIQLALAALAAVAQSVIYIAVTAAVRTLPPELTFGQAVGMQLRGSFLLGVQTYAGLALLLHGLRYQRALREREVAQSRLETQLAQARLTALRAQLNPHFLFNTLHSVSALMARDVPGARQMLTRLSDLLRLALETGADQECTLREEMEFVGHYIAIQEIRFRDRLQVSWEVGPDALEARVPRLLLQPLVENAIEHALDPHEERTRVRIAAARADGRLRLVVEDDGPGAGGAAVRERIGLGNTRARLAGLYGDAGTLEVRPSASGGTAVEVALPFRAGDAG
ncbi:MAG TPA: histidine kinase [Longimicrobium sp.]|jgi:signal transduction histidine kinase|uniref:sensor histidine kinase n=1 Tax=Longimicrobium sp. TaxID=2029185 RepID=UPI002ED99BF8